MSRRNSSARTHAIQLGLDDMRYVRAGSSVMKEVPLGAVQGKNVSISPEMLYGGIEKVRHSNLGHDYLFKNLNGRGDMISLLQ